MGDVLSHEEISVQSIILIILYEFVRYSWVTLLIKLQYMLHTSVIVQSSRTNYYTIILEF